MLGLVEAAHRFDPDLGIPFERYAANRIRGAVFDYARAQDPVGRTTRRRLKALRQLEDGAGSRRISDAVAAAALDVTEDELRSIVAAADRIRQVPLDTPVAAGATVADTIVEVRDSSLPEAATIAADEGRLLAAALGQLEPVRRDVLIRHYQLGQSITEIAETLGKSRTRIAQLHTEGIARLRGLMSRR